MKTNMLPIFSMPTTLKEKKLNSIVQSPKKPRHKTMKRKGSKLRVVKSLKQAPPSTPNMRRNEQFVEALSELAEIMTRKGEPFRAKAYKSAAEAIIQHPEDITDTNQLDKLKHVGKTILSKLHELQTTGKIQLLERERSDPLNQLTRVYGIGPKKAQEFVNGGIRTIEDLRNNQELLTTNMKLGLKYFDDIETRIPRTEIDEYKRVLTKTFTDCAFPQPSIPPPSIQQPSIPPPSIPQPSPTFEIVGSYRRGNETSGDIDIIITSAANDTSAYNAFLDALLHNGTILETLSRGKTKSMTIARLAPDRLARRIDFLYAPPDEYAFALLYFTGSKTFNTIQRQRALDRGFSLNEHGFYKMNDRKKSTTKLSQSFPTEASIFEFLEMGYREPHERIDARSVIEGAQSVNTLLETFRKRGTSAINTFSEGQLNEMIRKANETYHGNDPTTAPMFTDAEYDILCETTATRFPTNQVVNEGHTNTKIEVTKNKSTLPFEMWSMDKIKPNTQALEKWKRTYKGPYVLSCKLDGVSGLYVSETKVKSKSKSQSQPPKLYTRGNGIVGQDVSHLIPYLKLPTTKGIVLRGEFVISKSTFQSKYADKFANPRNFVAGAVNQKKVEPDKFADIDFVCYEVIQPTLKPSEQMALLATMDAVSAKHTSPPIDANTLTNEHLSKMLQEWRTNYTYEIDGIVCSDDRVYPRTSGNPAHAFAFKMMLSDQMAEAKVVNVHWTPSKDGYLKPRVQIEPVVLGGARIEYATGFNAKFVRDNRIGVGAIVRIIRSGDVIPHIVEVVEQATAPCMPAETYVWNPTGVDIVLENPETDAVVREKNIAGFFRNIGVEGLSTGNTRKLIGAGFDTIPKIIRMTQDDFLGVDGFKARLATKIRTGIETKLDEATLAELMHASNMFGRGFGQKKLQTILDAEPTIVQSDASSSDLVSKLQTIPGMAAKTSSQFGKTLPAFVAWMEKAGLEAKLNATPNATPLNTNQTKANPLYGKKYVITGFRDKALVKKLTELGAINSTSVSKNTDFVIVKSKGHDGDTGKAKEARALGLKLVTPSELMK